MIVQAAIPRRTFAKVVPRKKPSDSPPKTTSSWTATHPTQTPKSLRMPAIQKATERYIVGYTNLSGLSARVFER